MVSTQLISRTATAAMPVAKHIMQAAVKPAGAAAPALGMLARPTKVPLEGGGLHGIDAHPQRGWRGPLTLRHRLDQQKRLMSTTSRVRSWDASLKEKLQASKRAPRGTKFPPTKWQSLVAKEAGVDTAVDSDDLRLHAFVQRALAERAASAEPTKPPAP